jgi:hypothetical protein
MEIIAHRGTWNTIEQQNTLQSFYKSFEINVGIETDLRDLNGKLVISHNCPINGSVNSIDDFFLSYIKSKSINTLAINIKSDGLQDLLDKKLNEHKIKNYFVFDMSIPDTLGYIKKNLKIFTRQSEFELEPIFYDQSIGVWLDSFDSTWFDASLISKHLENGKKVAIVSPELHKREKNELWHMLKEDNIFLNNNILLCTDFPLEAQIFFK